MTGATAGAAAATAALVSRLRRAGCVFAEDEAALLIEAAATPEALEAMVTRRVGGEPLEHVVGFVDFCGLRLAVDEGVFVPRQRTRLLVREAVRRLTAYRPAASHGLEATDPGAVLVDLACGAGAVGAAVATAVPGVRLHAVDIDPAAVRCARRNLAPLHAEVHEGDLFGPLPAMLKGHVTVLVANVPYVPTEAVPLLPPEARDHEPLVALDGGHDGLDVMRRMVTGAPPWLVPGGHVLVETGTGQVEAAQRALTDAGLTPTVVHDEDLYATVVIGTLTRPVPAPM